MKILHVVPGLEEPTNEIARAAKRIAAEQVALGHEVKCVEMRVKLLRDAIKYFVG